MTDIKKEEDKKQLLEEEKKIQAEAQIRAYAEIEKKKIEEKEKKKKEVLNREKKNNVNNKFLVKFVYSIPEISGDKKFEFRNFKGNSSDSEYPIINTNDIVLYVNEEHPNNMKKAVVTHHSIVAGRVKFVLLFNDPPFVWEINKRTGDKIKTKKKIKVIQNVDYENMKKLGSSLNDDFSLKIRNLGGVEQGDTANIRSYLEDPYSDNRTNINQNNAILVLYQIFIQLMDFKFMNYDNKYFFSFELYDESIVTREKISNKEKTFMEKYWNNIKKKETINKLKKQLSQKNFDKEYMKKKLLSLKKVIKNKVNIFKEDFTDMAGFEDHIMNFQKLFSIDSQLTLTELFTGGIKNISKTEEKKKFERMQLNNKQFEYKKGITLFDSIFKMILPGNFGLNDMSKFGINNDLDKITFIKNIIKNKASISEKKVLLVETVIEKKIQEFIKKLFYKEKRFYPELVKFKYSGAKKEDNKVLIEDPNKLVAPSESKIFRLAKTPEPIQLFQENDFKLENKEKNKVGKIFRIDKLSRKIDNRRENGLITVELMLDLNVETVLSPEEQLEESKTKSTFRIIGDIVTNVKNKLNCQKSKMDFQKNLKEIGDIFDKYVKPPPMFDLKEEKSTDSDVYIHTVKVTPDTTIIKNTVVPKGTKVDFGPKVLPKKQPEKEESEKDDSEKYGSKESKKNNSKKSKKKRDESKKVMCPICKEWKNNRQHLQNHMAIKHSTEPTEENEVKAVAAASGDPSAPPGVGSSSGAPSADPEPSVDTKPSADPKPSAPPADPPADPPAPSVDPPPGATPVVSPKGQKSDVQIAVGGKKTLKIYNRRRRKNKTIKTIKNICK